MRRLILAAVAVLGLVFGFGISTSQAAPLAPIPIAERPAVIK